MSEYTVCGVIRHPPFGTVRPAEAYRTIQALQTFEREVTVLFMADGVLTMIEANDPEPIGMQPLAGVYVDLLTTPGVRIAIHTGSLGQRGYTKDDLVDLPEGVTPFRFVDSEEIEEYITGHKTVLCF